MTARSVSLYFALALMARRANADEGVSHPHKLHRFWGGLTFGFNAEIYPSGTDVCSTKTSGWICTTNDYVVGGPLYPDQTYPPRVPFAGQAGHVGGGLGYGGVQLMVGTFDFAITENLLLGARFGFYFHRANAIVNASELTGDAFAIAEARATWVFGSHPISEGAIAPYSLLGVGIADFSTPVSTTVVDAAGSHRVDAWKVAGPGFVTAGVGLRIGLGRRAALMIAPLKLTIPFGAGSLVTWMPEVSLMSAPF